MGIKHAMAEYLLKERRSSTRMSDLCLSFCYGHSLPQTPYPIHRHSTSPPRSAPRPSRAPRQPQAQTARCWVARPGWSLKSPAPSWMSWGARWRSCCCLWSCSRPSKCKGNSSCLRDTFSFPTSICLKDSDRTDVRDKMGSDRSCKLVLSLFPVCITQYSSHSESVILLNSVKHFHGLQQIFPVSHVIVKSVSSYNYIP